MKRIMMCGYYGYDNCGDEAILKTILQTLRTNRSDLHVTVLSGNPEKTKAQYSIEAIHRYDLKNVIKELRKADLLLFGGGALLQDITSSRSLYYYLSILSLAKNYKVKTMVYANGLGPICSSLHQRMTRQVLDKVDVITLRDQGSVDFLKKIGVRKPPITLTADPVFCFPESDLTLENKLLKEAGLSEEESYAAVTIRNWKLADAQLADKTAFLCRTIYRQYGWKVLFLPMQYEEDLSISKAVMEKMGAGGYLIERSLGTEEISALIKSGKLMIGMRLHGLIFAARHGVPSLALSYDPKVTNFMAMIHSPYVIDAEQMKEENLAEMLTSLMDQYDLVKEKLKRSRDKFKASALDNTKMLLELLDHTPPDGKTE